MKAEIKKQEQKLDGSYHVKLRFTLCFVPSLSKPTKGFQEIQNNKLKSYGYK